MSRHLYPGGNTCYGFHSFYQYLAPADIKHKIILKGGPGVGKSTLMKKLAEQCQESRMNVDYFWCSSDNNSLDGIVITASTKVCVLDGTSPHIVVTIV